MLTINGTDKDNIMIGDNISNTMRGLDGADQMIGGEGNDNMSRDGRADYILGDAGADIMKGAMEVIKYLEVMGMITSLVDMEQMK